MSEPRELTKEETLQVNGSGLMLGGIYRPPVEQELARRYDQNATALWGDTAQPW
jgi:hypothetical protein